MGRVMVERLGQVFKTNNYGVCTIVEYVDCRNVSVMFEDGTIVRCKYNNLERGNVRNPMIKSTNWVGYIGDGPHKAKADKCGIIKYNAWNNMLRRCYDTGYQEKHPTYNGCYVHSDWHNFQNFAEWMSNIEYYSTGWHLDKDLLFLGNKIYSKDTCLFIPQEINKLIFNREKKNTKFPVGVGWSKKLKKYSARCGNGAGGRKFLGFYETVGEAYSAYKQAKIMLIRQQAEKWKDQIDPRAYEALLDYQILGEN